jgi:hypothetical protein
MARMTFPQDATTFVYQGELQPILTSPRTGIAFFVDALATEPADMTWLSGAPITDSTVYTGRDGTVPRFLGPDDGTVVLYARPLGTTETYPVQALISEQLQQANSLTGLSDVDTTGAQPAQVLALGPDGVWRPANQTGGGAAPWGDAVAFSEAEPDAATAPDGAVWVHIGDDMRLYRKGP